MTLELFPVNGFRLLKTAIDPYYSIICRWRYFTSKQCLSPELGLALNYTTIVAPLLAIFAPTPACCVLSRFSLGASACTSAYGSIIADGARGERPDS